MPVRASRRAAGWLGLGAVAAMTGAAGAAAEVPVADGIRRLASKRDHAATVQGIEREVAARAIRHFATIDQAALAPAAGLELPASTLILFGNPRHGLRFLAASPLAGLDWPVRMLVTTIDEQVTIAWTDFAWMARHYGIARLDDEVAIASRTAYAIARAAAG